MRLLGAFALEYEGDPIEVPSSRTQAFLAYLALHHGDVPSRQSLAFLLWPDSTEQQAHTNLRTLLHRSKSLVPDDKPWLQLDGQTVRWHPSLTLNVDTLLFEAKIHHAQATTDLDSLCDGLEEAITLYSGDLLPDCYDEWMLTERERLRQLFLSALERLVTSLEQLRRYAPAIAYARRLLQMDPLNEAVYLILVRLYAVTGERATALRLVHQCMSMLRTELGVTPGQALLQTYRRLLDLETGEVEQIPPIRGSAPLVGRDEEWRRMQDSWRAARTGRPQLLMLSGDAGVGKTRLAEELLLWATRQGFVTAAAACYPAEDTLTYAPLAALIRSPALHTGLARLAPEWRSELARLAPDVVAGTDWQTLEPVSEPWQRQRLFEAITRYVLASGQPTLLLFDDLQWCDPDTLEWLRFFMRHLSPIPRLVLMTVRAEEVDSAHPMVQAINALRASGYVSELALQPLKREETAALAEHLLGHTLTPDQSDKLFVETEGNALFVVETIRSGPRLDTSSEAATSSLSKALPTMPHEDVPQRVRAIIERRLSLLSSRARALMEVAAVIGRSFTYTVLVGASDLEEDNLVLGIDELWQRRIVREQGADAYDFTHEKLRVIAYGQLSAARKRMIHRQVAQALQSAYAHDLDAIAGQIALHYEQVGQHHEAIAFYRQAAGYSRRLYANEIAVAHYQHALALAAHDAHEVTSDLHEQVGEVLQLMGRHEEARVSLQRALDVCAPDDWLRQANLLRKMGNSWRDESQHQQALDVYTAAEERLKPLLDDSTAAQAAWVQINLERINVLYWLGETDALLGLLEQVGSVLEEGGSLQQRARFHRSMISARLRQNRYSRSDETLRQARIAFELTQQADDSAALPGAYFMLGFTQLWCGDDLQFALDHITTAETLAHQRGDVTLFNRCQIYRTIIARRSGDVDTVSALAQQCLDSATTYRMLDYVGVAQSNLAWVAWRAGDLLTTRTHALAALEVWRQYRASFTFEWLARLPLMGVLLAEDHVHDAAAQIPALLESQQMRLPEDMEAHLLAAQERIAEDDIRSTRTFLDAALDVARARNYL